MNAQVVDQNQSRFKLLFLILELLCEFRDRADPDTELR